MTFNKTSSILLTLSLCSTQIAQPMAEVCTRESLKMRDQIIFGVLAAGGVCFAAKHMYNYYYDYVWPHAQLIEYNNTIYNKIQFITQQTTLNYNEAINNNDDGLKQTIRANTVNDYCFKRYYKQLTQDIASLKAHATSIENELERIQKRTIMLSSQPTAENSAFLATLTELAIKMNTLRTKINMLIIEIIQLKKRVTSFEEYQEECIAWNRAHAHHMQHNNVSENNHVPYTSHETHTASNRTDLYAEYQWLVLTP